MAGVLAVAPLSVGREVATDVPVRFRYEILVNDVLLMAESRSQVGVVARWLVQARGKVATSYIR